MTDTDHHESTELRVEMPLHPDKVVVDAVMAEAKHIYGDTPLALEAVGFFMTAYRVAIDARMGISQR